MSIAPRTRRVTMYFLQSKKLNIVWIVRGTSAVVIALAFTGVLGVAGMSVNQELRVIAPSQLARGESFPVRALLFDGLSAIQGPQLVDGDLHAALVDVGGK